MFQKVFEGYRFVEAIGIIVEVRPLDQCSIGISMTFQIMSQVQSSETAVRFRVKETDSEIHVFRRQPFSLKSQPKKMIVHTASEKITVQRKVMIFIPCWNNDCFLFLVKLLKYCIKVFYFASCECYSSVVLSHSRSPALR